VSIRLARAEGVDLVGPGGLLTWQPHTAVPSGRTSAAEVGEDGEDAPVVVGRGC
jgi:hypothetical protein